MNKKIYFEPKSVKVSIVVPIYNIEEYLPVCVESIISQTHENIEIILVDDGSPDACPSICDDYAVKDERIRVIHKGNGGLVSARKAGVRVATGDYVLYVDGDDWIDSNYVENMLKPAITEKVDVISTIAVYMNYSDGRQLERITPMDMGIYREEDMIKKVYPNFICEDKFYDTSLPTNIYLYMFKREFLQNIQEQVDDEITMGEDMAVTFRSLLEANSLAVINCLGYHYRQRPNSMLHKKSREHFLKINTLYKNLQRAVKHTNNRDRALVMERKIARGIFFALWVGASNEMIKISENYLFPFSRVKPGSKIFVYGMGVVGYGIMEAILSREDYILVGCSDQGWKAHKDGLRFADGNICKVYPTEKILECDFDYVIIGVSRYNFRKQITELLLNLGVPEKKIALIDQSQLIEENLPFYNMK